MSIIANFIKWFRKTEKQIIDSIPEPTDVWVPPAIIKTSVGPKPKSNRKPGPKKQVPGTAVVKSPGTTPNKPRTYNKPKKKVHDA